MGCQTKVALGDSVVFSICTHDPDTGVLTDTDSLPTYRVYEDEGATPVWGGNMAKLNDAKTTGLYASTIRCTIRNGFERGKTYTVYIEAIVDGDKGGMCYAFKPYFRWDAAIIEGVNLPTNEFHHINGRIRYR